jgi:hypothetical protein
MKSVKKCGNKYGPTGRVKLVLAGSGPGLGKIFSFVFNWPWGRRPSVWGAWIGARAAAHGSRLDTRKARTD